MDFGVLLSGEETPFRDLKGASRWHQGIIDPQQEILAAQESRANPFLMLVVAVCTEQEEEIWKSKWASPSISTAHTNYTTSIWSLWMWT